MSDELIKFNEMFPNSKYREINPQYTGPMETAEDKENYQKSKRPLNSKLLSFEEIKNTSNRIGWWVPKEYIVIDIDNKNNAKIVFDILKARNVKFSYMTGRKGGHFIFKNKRKIPSISAGQACSLGITVDVRCNEKGYIILPENDTDRRWGNITNDLDDVPFYLVPLKDFKVLTEFNGMGEGSGRNDALLKHMLTLIDYAKALKIDEKVESIKIINQFLFSKPIPEDELNKTILREEIVNKEQQEKPEKKCYEEQLACKIVKEQQLISANDVSYIYTGKYYKPMRDNALLEKIIHESYNANLKYNQRQEVIKFIKLKTHVESKELNKNWRDIVFRNGVLDLNTMELRPHTPDEYNTTYIDINFVREAPYSSRIDTFFNQLSGGDIETKTLLYEIIGTTLVRRNIFSKFFICYGQGQTGKSTYLRLIAKVLGPDNTSYLALNDLEEQFMPINLFGKLANLGDDIPYFIRETANLKKLVTGEEFEAQVKHKDSVHFSNFATFVFTTNSLPEVTDRSSGFYRRFMIVELNNKVENPDPFFFERLTEQDYEYLLWKSINALLDAMKRNKLTETADSLIKLEEYRTEQSSVLMFLREFEYDRKVLDHRPCMDLYTEYDAYCRDTGFKPLKKVKFDKEVCEELRMSKRNTTWKGDAELNQCWRFV